MTTEEYAHIINKTDCPPVVEEKKRNKCNHQNKAFEKAKHILHNKSDICDILKCVLAGLDFSRNELGC